MISKAVFVSLILCTVVSCGGESYTDPVVEFSELNSGINFDSGAGIATELDGNWVKLCGYQELEGTAQYSIVNIEFSGNNFSTVIENYSDSACNQLTSQATTLSGKFSIEDALFTANGAPVNGVVFGFGNSQQTGFYRPEFNIYSLSTGSLYFGLFTNDYNGTTKFVRPIELAYDQVFIRLTP